MVLSNYQVNIINHICNSSKNLLVNAKAGTGKSSTMVLAVREYLKIFPNAKVGMCAFNKSAVNDLREKVGADSRVEIFNSHQFARKALVDYLGHSKFDIAKSNSLQFKVYNSIEEYSNILTSDCKNNLKWDYSLNVSKGYDICRQNLLTENDSEKIIELFNMYNIDCVADEIGCVTKMLATAYDIKSKYVENYMLGGKWLKKKYLVIDFIDMLTFAALHPNNCQKFDLFINDEAQDYNECQHRLILNCLKPNGKWVAVGDDKQAINGFAGALNDSFGRLANFENVDILPLNVNYRCGKKIIELAQTIVPSIEAFENAIDGNVEHIDNLSNLRAKDFVLCRTKAPLVKLCLKLLANNQLANVLGTDISKGLKALINTVCEGKKGRFITTTELRDNMQSYYNKKVQTLIDKGTLQAKIDANQGLADLKDKIECIEAISLNCLTTEQVNNKIDSLFSDEQKDNAVILMTAHKSKGLEAENVFIILPSKLPLVWKNQLEWQHEQEVNLQYVAYTRAKKNLYIVDEEEKIFDLDNNFEA